MNKKIITIFIIIFLLTLFYWFQIRPSEIKTSCQNKSDEYIHRAVDREDKNKDGLISQDSVDWLSNYAKKRYERCLHRNGL